ncbi:MAG: alpha-mannosidase [Clostridiales bacterium]|jgi:alpha-mannosidase|nr:alpha-mannosidase [Clostridiales bacterium]
MKEIHLICNAHIDPVWLWDWEEGAAAAIATFRAAADLSERYEYIFCHNEALLYQWVEKYEPALFARIRGLVKAGKWHITGGWYLQPDCNMPAGESLVRQAMTGRNYFAEKFGAAALPETAMNVDPFGHSWGLPQILKKCGYKNYLFMRPLPGDKQPVPTVPFVWRGPDGSAVKAANGGIYSSERGRLDEKVNEYYSRFGVEGNPDVQILCWGVGNHGGGPSAKDLDYIHDEITHGTRAKLIHSTPDRYFARLTPTVVHKKSLNLVMPGCYTSQIRVKQKHRALENRLYSTEKMLSAAALCGLLSYPQKELTAVVETLLFMEFHDILPGTSVRQGEETALKRFDYALTILDELRARAFFALTAGLPRAKEGDYPILVYNAHPYAVTTTVDCEFILAVQNRADGAFTGAEVYDGGKKLPTQMRKESSSINLDWAKRVVFDCMLPPFSMKLFTARTLPLKKNVALPLAGDTYVHEDAFKRVTFNLKTGFVDGLTVGGREFVKKGAFAPVVYLDNPDPWGMSEAQRRRLGKREKAFKLMTPNAVARFFASDRSAVAPLRIVEDGAVCRVIEGCYAYNRSTIVMRYTLYKNSAETDIALRVLWAESDRMLKLQIPVAFSGRYEGQIAYGRERLSSTGAECVSQQWVAYTNKEQTLAVLNDGVYGSSCKGAEIGLTLLRGAVYAAHPVEGRPIILQDRLADRIDMGERFFNFKLLAGSTAAIGATLDRKAQTFNEKPFAVNLFPSGDGEAPVGTVRLSDDTVVLTAFKKAERGAGYILRLFNNTDKRAETRLTVFGTESALTFKKYEIKTLRYADGKITECAAAEI